MLNIYYSIWADAIVLEKAKKARPGGWKAFTLIPISLLQGINLLSLLLLIRLLSHKRYPVIFPMSIFNLVGLNTFCSLLLTYFIPFLIINYLFIFYNNRYEQVLKTNNHKHGKLYRLYALVTIGIIVVPFVVKVIF